jgi:hypothetical protein
MVAARPERHFEFFAQAHQNTLAIATLATSKKARPDCSGAGCEVQGKLEVLEKSAVVSSFAV